MKTPCYDYDHKKSAFKNSPVTDSGQMRFMVLLHDVIKSITKLDDSDSYILTVGVFHSLVDTYDRS